MEMVWGILRCCRVSELFNTFRQCKIGIPNTQRNDLFWSVGIRQEVQHTRKCQEDGRKSNIMTCFLIINPLLYLWIICTICYLLSTGGRRPLIINDSCCSPIIYIYIYINIIFEIEVCLVTRHHALRARHLACRTEWSNTQSCSSAHRKLRAMSIVHIGRVPMFCQNSLHVSIMSFKPVTPTDMYKYECRRERERERETQKKSE